MTKLTFKYELVLVVNSNSIIQYQLNDFVSSVGRNLEPILKVASNYLYDMEAHTYRYVKKDDIIK